MTTVTYKNSGVDVDAANALKQGFLGVLNQEDMTLNQPKAFAAIIDAGLKNYSDPVLVLKSEEPGSKQIIAFSNDRVESVCEDMINHLINDCIMCGAVPVSIQDVIVCGQLDPALVKRCVVAMAKASAAQGCFLSGGETSEQPGVLPEDRYILSSSIIGVIERSKIVDGKTISPGDKVVALASSGLHTNGYSLVRYLMANNSDLAESDVDGRSFLDVALDVHACYFQCLAPLFKAGLLKGAAHITGGGIAENLDRVLPSSIDAVIDLDTYRPQKIFTRIREEGAISDQDMLRTFNLGVGAAVVVAADKVAAVLAELAGHDQDAWVIGETVKGTGSVTFRGELQWSGM